MNIWELLFQLLCITLDRSIVETEQTSLKFLSARLHFRSIFIVVTGRKWLNIYSFSVKNGQQNVKGTLITLLTSQMCSSRVRMWWISYQFNGDGPDWWPKDPRINLGPEHCLEFFISLAFASLPFQLCKHRPGEMVMATTKTRLVEALRDDCASCYYVCL